MKQLISILVLAAFPVLTHAQVKNLYASEIIPVDLSLKKQKAIERQTVLLAKETLTESEKTELDSLLHLFGETTESIWDIVGGGCSWYCGGGNYKVLASSSLNDKSGIDYWPSGANDLSYNTAWVAGKNKGGIGEFIEYHFENKSPRLTSIIISNGYYKSESTWKNNNRVRKLRLSVNGKPYAILNLKDIRADQLFKVETLGHNSNGTDLVLRFEILEIFKGSKFDHTALTEIYFDGIDVH